MTVKSWKTMSYIGNFVFLKKRAVGQKRFGTHNLDEGKTVAVENL